MTDAPGDSFWEVLEHLLDEPDIDQGTIMRFDCLRVNGEFAAAPHHTGSGVILKLSAERVQQLIGDGVAAPFAPAGRAFREWAHLDAAEPAEWLPLVEEAVAFARGRSVA